MDSKPGGTKTRAEAEAEVIKTVEEIVASASAKVDDSTITLSTGVVLDVFGGVSLPVATMIEEKYKAPKVPVVYDEDRGREIENPSHPDYLAEVQWVHTAKGMAIIDAAIVLCTKLKTLPDGMSGPDDLEWQEMLTVLGIEIPTTPIGKYLLWVKSIAATTEHDTALIMESATRRLGVREEDVAKAMSSFQSDDKRGADSPSETG